MVTTTRQRARRSVWLSVIVPTLNEASNLPTTLAPLQKYRHSDLEIIVSDGGSQDNTCQLARRYADRLITGAIGRARQMNAGAEAAEGEVLWFLHADTRVPPDFMRPLRMFRRMPRNWGRFNVKLSNDRFIFSLIAFLVNTRSALSGIATGDQAIFIKRPVFSALGGYAGIPLMEDVELCRRLKHYDSPLCLRDRVVTSARKWQRNGIWSTIFLMWRLRWQYWRGYSPSILVEHYYRRYE